jgi:hypothetical protein
MKGPKLRSPYSCENCDQKSEVTMSLVYCGLLVTFIRSNETPEKCPYLIKEVRKRKLNKLNEKTSL